MNWVISATKLLIIRLMGKHNNIIFFCQEDGMILDSIKHVSAQGQLLV